MNRRLVLTSVLASLALGDAAIAQASGPIGAADVVGEWSLLVTPAFPEYVSGHSTYSGAAAEVLTRLYGDNYEFTTTSLGLPGVTRSYTSFNDAAKIPVHWPACRSR